MRTHRQQSRSGVALVLVLMLVVLTTIVIIAFFGSVKTETNSTRSAVGIQNSRQLADLAVQTVISQIQQATQTSSTRPPGTVSWASQPGMIRCYDNTGAELELYKLYSSGTMTALNPTSGNILTTLASDLPENSGTTTPAGDWATPGSGNYGVFTDLNSPVYASDGTTLEYPIVNPAAATSIAAATGTKTNAVLGFDISPTAPGYSATGTASPVINNPAAMPVRWLYVLQSGTMVPGIKTGTSGTVSVKGASASNPIVGRVAFWTDDETCKLNVNTAADGSYLDTPRFASLYPKIGTSLASESMPQQDIDILVDRQMGVTPPATYEYQRYIGNPAQTRLSYVLGPAIAASGIANRSHLLTLISPFMQWGGSEAGTLDSTNWGTGTTTQYNPNRQTLYASLDEWMFSTGLNASNIRTLNTGSATPLNSNVGTGTLVTNTRLQQLRFFLSSNSDAPEVNLFGQPRISMWPIFTGTLATNGFPLVGTGTLDPHVSTFDQLIANASTLYGAPAASRAPSGTATVPYAYYFGRQNSGSPYVDFDGGSPTLSPGSRPVISRSSTSNNTRNENIFLYLETLANANVPGYGLSFDAKYSSGEMDQIITEIFDYCRILDSYDQTVGATYCSTSTLTQSNPLSLPLPTPSGTTTAAGQVTPISIPSTQLKDTGYTTQGFGRFYSINEVSLDFAQAIIKYTGTKTVLTGMIHVSLNSPAVGFPQIDPHMKILIQSPGANSGTISMPITVNSTTGTTFNVFGPPANLTSYPSGTTTVSANSGRSVFSVVPLQRTFLTGGNNGGWNNGPAGALAWGGDVGTRPLMLMKNSTFTGTPTTGTVTALGGIAGNYEFCGQPIICTGTNTGTMTISMVGNTTIGGKTGVPLEIKLYHTNSLNYMNPQNGSGPDGPHIPDPTTEDGYPGNDYELVQDITVFFPNFTNLPFPTNMLYTGSSTTTDTYTSGPLIGQATGTLTHTLNYRGEDTSSSWQTWLSGSVTVVGPTTVQDISARFGPGPGYGPGNGGVHYPINSGDVVESVVVGYNGDSRLVAAQHYINDLAMTSTFTTPTSGASPSPAFVPHPLYGKKTSVATGPANLDGGWAMATSQWECFVRGNAQLQGRGYSNPSVVYSGTSLPLTANVTGTGQFVSAAVYSGNGQSAIPGVGTSGTYTNPAGANCPISGPINPALAGNIGAPDFTGDFDNGLGYFSDGPYINKADEVGGQYYIQTGAVASATAYLGNGGLYYQGGGASSSDDISFSSPNRTVASPVMFGSLPTGVPLGKYTTTAKPSYTPYSDSNNSNAQNQLNGGAAVPWQTLLFRPQVGHYGGSNGGATIEDEILLDWFWMPVVQPYAISTAFATQGKVNMNYQIAPFSYITRATALLGVLGSENVIAAPVSAGGTYKTDGKASYPTYRLPVKVLQTDSYTLADDDGTFRQFKDRFKTGEIFRSAAEICDIYLEPATDTTGAAISWGAGGADDSTYITAAESFWTNNKLTGDNSRERPYNGLYSRLTTKSNTYTVHVRAQALKQPSNGAADTWVENPQLIMSEYRGAVTINRYLDPQDTNIPDFMSVGGDASSNFDASNMNSTAPFRFSIDNYYKYRVLETRQFLP